MNITNFLKLSSLEELRDVINLEAKYKYMYYALNTGVVISSVGNKYVWNLNEGNNLSSQAVTVYDSVKNIIGMRISPFILDFTLNQSDPYTFYQFNLLVEEFIADSQSTATGRKFHFTVLNADNQTGESKTRAYLNGNADGYYWFKNPISTVNSLTISVAKVEDDSLIVLPDNMCIHLQLVYLDKIDL